MADNKKSNVRIILNNYVKPEVKEVPSKDWVLNGDKNSYFKYVNNRYIGSPTNSAIINGYCRLIYGKGLSVNDANKNPIDAGRVKFLLSKKDVRRVVKDFYTQGMAYLQVIRNMGGKISSITHVSVDKIAPNKKDEYNNIPGYWFSNDWSNQYKPENKPEYIPAFSPTDPNSIYCIKPYQLDRDYFALPSYQAGLQYAELEEEISNFAITHIKNGLSFGSVINIPDSNTLEDSKKKDIEYNFKKSLTGSSNAGKIVVNFAQGDKKITVEDIEVNNSHDKWESLANMSREQLITAHEVVSPMLFGIKDANGFSSNADELDIAESQTIKRVIQPMQDELTDSFEEILSTDGINLDLYFRPLTEKPANSIDTQLSKHICCSKDDNGLSSEIADELISLGEEIGEGWVSIDERKVNYHTLTEKKLTNLFNLARVPSSSPSNNSEQDTSLFKIRYKYTGNPSPEREFCRKVMQADKVYTSEALDRAGNVAVNKGFGPNGSDTYSIWLYKGGVNCKHFWQRTIFLKENNDQISVNQARRMILELEPEERKDARWQQNPKEVAQIASESNNYWKLS